ncbi:MAG TPA: tryptophan--tRNA ligase [Gemmatimonadales bacterium]|nr:tryptophan--tRNA ligase [Gemmatimonadales bacterium]
MPRIFSGIQPTGELHIGNWLGAVRNMVHLQDRYESLFCIVDLHAITGAFYDPAQHRRRTLEMALGLLAAGIDPERATLFVQSHVPAHSELMWLLNAVTPVGELERMTQYKDKSAQLESIPAGLLNYPILMTADILLYRADLVPVGEDQVQHLELARETVRRWNAAYAAGTEVMPEPQPLLTEAKRIMGLDGETKMSKSRGNTIGMLDSPEEIWQKLRPAKTDPARKTRKDPGTPEICNIYDYHKHFSPPETVERVATNCRGALWGCLDCKRVLADNMAATLAPIRERAADFAASPGRVREVLAAGAVRAGAIATETLAAVHDHMGFLPQSPELD